MVYRFVSLITLSFLFFAVSPVSGQPCFSQTAGPAVVTPKSIAAGDFDGDLDIDLAIANSGSQSVSIFLNDGFGNFTINSTPAVGNSPFSVITGNFDGDTDLDLAIANEGSNTVTVLLNNGSAIFTPTVITPAVGNNPYSVTAGDFDGDTDLDLASANFGTDDVTILINDGAATFSQGGTISVGKAPSAITVGDFDGDLDLDIATTNSGPNSVSVLINDGLANFTAKPEIPVGSNPFSLEAGDLDGDTDVDLAVPNKGPNTISILKNDGNGNFTLFASPSVGADPVDIIGQDWDVDGDLDLAIANEQDGTVSVMENNGTGTFTQIDVFSVGTAPSSITGGDFDGDGDPDLAVTNFTSATVSILNNVLILVSPTTLPDAPVGTAYNQTLLATGGVEPYTFSVTSGALPPGISLDSATGAISGTPPAFSQGSYSFSITVADASGCSTSLSYTINVVCLVVVTVDPPTLPDPIQGQAYSQTILASGGAAPYTFAVSSGSLPPGLALDSVTGDLSGTPPIGSTGVYTFTITATDSNGCEGSREYIVTVVCAVTIIVDPPTLPDGVIGTAYNATIVASGGTGPYTFSVSVGNLPAGLVLDTNTGVISGTPSAGSEGSYDFTITASDANSCPGSRNYIVNITCSVAIGVDPPTLPSGSVGTPYNQTLTGTGGTGPYTFAVDSGSLPPGLTLDSATGVISGTPNSGGSFPFTIRAFDAGSGCSGTREYTVFISGGACLFCDDFEDGVIDPNWTYVKPAWTESGGVLAGTPSGRKAVAIATPIFSGCASCTVETAMQTAGGSFNKLWLLGWYIDKRNTMELMMAEENDKWILKQRVNGIVVAKNKGIQTILPNTIYTVRVMFDGTQFQVFVDDLVTPLFSLTPIGTVPTGTVGFQAKNTTGSFSYIQVN